MEYRQCRRYTKEDIGNGRFYLGRLGKLHREVTRISEDEVGDYQIEVCEVNFPGKESIMSKDREM